MNSSGMGRDVLLFDIDGPAFPLLAMHLPPFRVPRGMVLEKVLNRTNTLMHFPLFSVLAGRGEPGHGDGVHDNLHPAGEADGVS